MEEERIKKPPSHMVVRTFKSDVEQMRQSGGKTGAGIILGKKLEEVEEEREEKIEEEKKPLFEAKDELEPVKKKKSKLLPIVIIIVIVFIFVMFVVGFYVYRRKNLISNK